ncbi:hypothetical protein E2K98_25095 [Bacillus salipaludis]|uniref:Uncharacterized protein n=1 Tax=Bacillus salipaludis TaxID=2547811 RepID=A0A4R5VJI0_9BACI|nr:hypothetical protein [Bacillus salipaludis]TDK57335.1 hypothetical protein E2K98_25095 [Bacillus salipaludis]
MDAKEKEAIDILKDPVNVKSLSISLKMALLTSFFSGFLPYKWTDFEKGFSQCSRGQSPGGVKFYISGGLATILVHFFPLKST